MNKLMLTSALIATTVLAGCDWYDNRNIETPPVTVKTQYGPVICQLYREDIVWFDRAWVKPETMPTNIANEICQAEGKRIKAGGQRDRTNYQAGFKTEASQ